MFGLSYALSGALIGAVMGLVSMAIILNVVGRLERDGNSDEKRRTAGLLRSIAWLDVFLFAAVGYFVGPMVFG